VVLRGHDESSPAQLEAVAVRLDNERPPPQVQPLVPHGLDHDQLPFVGGEATVAGCYWLVHWPAALMKNRAGGVTFHHERLGEV
jgi:hypothetical protein